MRAPPRDGTSMATVASAGALVPPLIASPASAAGSASGEAFGEGLLFGGYLGGAAWLAWFIIAFFIAIWVYRDARSRGTSGSLWAIVVIILPVLGIVLYMMMRPAARTPRPDGMAPPGDVHPPQGPPS